MVRATGIKRVGGNRALFVMIRLIEFASTSLNFLIQYIFGLASSASVETISAVEEA